MFLYTWLNGECPISYVCKKMIDSNYVAGEKAFIPEPYSLLFWNNNCHVSLDFGECCAKNEKI